MSLIGQKSKVDITELFGRHVSSGKVDFFQQAGIDFIIGRREGVYVYDLEGQALINCHSNGGVFNLGHRNPRIIAALQRAVNELDIGNQHLISEARAILGQRLAALCPGDINHVVYGVSGGEAVDMAIKLARGYTGRPRIVSAEGGYHGHTGFALAAGDPMYATPFAPLPRGFDHVPYGDLDHLAAVMDDDVAAVLLETIPATLGIIIPLEGYLAAVRDLCDQHGALLILDEVQAGLGRCGTVWGFETDGVVPDIIVSGKGLSGGIYPLTATLYRDPLDSFLRQHPFIHISTCGGSEVGCYTALEVLTILEEPHFLAHVQAMATRFATGLAELQQAHPHLLVEVRQRGLMMGLKLHHPSAGLLMSQAGYRAGLLLVFANNDPSAVQLLPPLIITTQQVDLVLDRLGQALTGTSEMLGMATASRV